MTETAATLPVTAEPASAAASRAPSGPPAAPPAELFDRAVRIAAEAREAASRGDDTTVHRERLARIAVAARRRTAAESIFAPLWTHAIELVEALRDRLAEPAGAGTAPEPAELVALRVLVRTAALALDAGDRLGEMAIDPGNLVREGVHFDAFGTIDPQEGVWNDHTAGDHGVECEPAMRLHWSALAAVTHAMGRSGCDVDGLALVRVRVFVEQVARFPDGLNAFFATLQPRRFGAARGPVGSAAE